MRTPTCQACSGKSLVPRAPLYWFHNDVLDRRRTLGIGGDEADRRGQWPIRIVPTVGPSAAATRSRHSLEVKRQASRWVYPPDAPSFGLFVPRNSLLQRIHNP